MAGPTHSLDSTINQVRNLLDDQYKWDGDGFTIWKELIQNANDTEKVDERHGVTQFHIGWCRGFEGAGHPLLTTPAMFVVNDGRFTHKNAGSILCFGDNDKRDKDWQIGRFGLGMKSVFHLCEAFFFLASDIPGDQVPKESHPKRADIFSPWIPSAGSGEVPPHPKWDKFDSPDQQLIRDRLVPIHRDMQEWFCVWIPLRHKTHLEDSGEALTADDPLYFETDDRIRSLFPESHATRIAELLPLLDQIKSVCIWEPSSLDSIKMTHAVNFADGSSSRKPLPHGGWHAQLPPLVESNFSGAIKCSGLADGQDRSHPYFGIERFLWDARFLDLHKRLPPDRRGRDRKVKAIPHAAVRFFATDCKQGESPRLTVNWAVFIPLSEAMDAPVTLPEGMPSVSLHLHGYFFVDAGRNRLKDDANATAGGNQTEKFRPEWNRFIEDEGTLPLIIPALDQFVRKASWSNSQIRKLTKALGKTPVWDEHSDQICRDLQWGFVLKPDATSHELAGQWMMFDAAIEVLSLPKTSSLDLPLRLFPTLADVVNGFHLTFADKPRLTRTAPKRSTLWPVEVVTKLLKSVDFDSLLADAACCDYLCRFLDVPCVGLGESLGAWMRECLQRLFANSNLQSLQERADLIQRLVDFVPSEERVCATWAESEQTGAQEVVAAIALMKLQVVVVPQMCEPDDDPCTGKLQAGDCESILNWLSDWDQKPTIEPKEYAKFVAWVFQRVDPKSRNDVIGSTAAVIKATKYAGDKPVDCWLSPQAVIEQEGDRNEFKFCDNVFADAENGDALAELSAAFVGWPILNLVPELAQAVFHNKTPPKYCEKVVRVVNQCEALLGEPDKRFAVLERLKTRDRIDGNSEKAKAIRYLLHGHQSHRADIQEVLIRPASKLTETVRSEQTGHFWEKLADWALSKTKSGWRLLSLDIANKLEQLFPVRDQLEALHIAPLDHQVVANLLSPLQAQDVSDFPSSIFDEYKSAYGEFLKNVTDVPLLKRLPIHQRAADQVRVAITDNKSYWDSGFEVDDELGKDVELLKPDGGGGASERRGQLAKSLSPRKAIELGLSRSQPSKHWETILNALQELKKEDLDELSDAIRGSDAQVDKKPWLPTASGDKWLVEIANLPELDSVLCKLRETIKGDIVFHSDIDQEIHGHPAFKEKLCGLLPNRDQSLGLIKTWMAGSNDCRIGVDSPEKFSAWIRLPWSEDVMPSYPVLQSVWKLCDENVCYKRLAASLNGSVEDHEKCINGLKFLKDQHVQLNLKQAISFRLSSIGHWAQSERSAGVGCGVSWIVGASLGV